MLLRRGPQPPEPVVTVHMGGLWVPLSVAGAWILPSQAEPESACDEEGCPSSGKEGNLLELGALLCLISDLHVIVESNMPRLPSLSS